MEKVFIIDERIAERLFKVLDECQAELAKCREAREEALKRDDENKLFGIRGACEYLSGINEDTLLYYRRLGLDYYKKGKDGVWYRKGDIDAWLATGRVSRHSPKK